MDNYEVTVDYEENDDQESLKVSKINLFCSNVFNINNKKKCATHVTNFYSKTPE